MFAFFKRRAFLLLIGFLLIAIFIWYAGPYFAFGTYHPLESEFSRLAAIGLVFVCWLISAIVKRLRASRATERLVGAVLSQAPREKERPSAEATKLRERFEEAVATLSKTQPEGRSLYDLPWYVFIGAPGSGKTTALVNSGLRFPVEQRGSRGAVRGVGGTRNCDWWFTSEAVFLDTAGRYTTQDSDATSDSEGWREFLALLTKYRKRRPLNGVVLTISAQDLLTQGDAGREAHVEAARRRLDELTRELQIRLPVYVMVTKCDTVAGFSEYFEDLNQDGRSQVWGVTFPYDQSMSGQAADTFPGEFDALMERLNGRVFGRLEEERGGGRRRASIFAFPQQMATLGEPLAQFVSDVFGASAFERRVLLRGVYLTSGTQDGTQIDRLLGSIGRRFGIAADAVAAPAAGRGKAFFVERLLKQVVIAESGLAGVNRSVEMRKAAWQLGAYAAIVLGLVLGLTVLTISYSRNRAYLDQVSADMAALRRATPALQNASLEVLLPQLTATRAVADSAERYRDDVPWAMRWGLYQGASVGNAARDAYLRELDGIVLPRFAARIRQRLVGYSAEPEKLYVYLKAYLMLGDPKHLDKKLLQFLADLEWKQPDATPGAGTSLAKHFQSLLEYTDTLRPIAIDQAVVAQARSTIRQASIAQIMYDQLRRSYSDDSARALHLDIVAGVGIEKVLRRKSGHRLSEPMPSIYTAKVFKEATTIGMAPLVKQFAEEDWVWGAGMAPAGFLKLTSEVTDLYERDYDRAWDDLLNDLEIVPHDTVSEYSDALGILVSPTSPLRGLLKTVVENTSLVAPAAEPPAGAAAAPSIGARIADSAKDLFSSAQKRITGGSGLAPGAVITQHFQPIHRLMAGSPAPLDGIFEEVRKIRDQLLTIGPQVGGSSSLKALNDPTLIDLRRALRLDAANLPPPIDTLIGQLAEGAGGTVSRGATAELDTKYQNEVVAECRTRVQGRYPFGQGQDIALPDFAQVFGPGGLYDRFFADNLDKLVDRTRRPWTWRPGSVSASAGILAQFERAERIRQLFFGAGAKGPELSFNVKLSKLDESATRFYVYLDGQSFDAKPGVESRWPAVWPGPKPGAAYAVFEDRIAAPEQVIAYGGPWAWFHVVDATLSSQPDGEGLPILSLQTRYHRALVTIEPSSGIGNPFAARDWRQFECGS
ncbi:MAG TPA: type VI secretion system membrane subunit TssM [Vicinamibacterales bacterium]|nr:type VI secretion system membrane subunit TssM [Vicinamibacterales bacterium]